MWRAQLRLGKGELPLDKSGGTSKIDFAMGNLYFDLGSFNDATNAYRRAIERAQSRVIRHRSQIAAWKQVWKLPKPGSPAERIIDMTVEGGSGVFSEAYNNLGNALAKRWSKSTNSAERANLAEGVVSAYILALANSHYPTPNLPLANLAEFFFRSERPGDFLDVMAEALRVKPDHVITVSRMLELAHQLPDLTNAARGYSIAFDALITTGESPQDVEAIARLLPELQKRLLSQPGNEDAVRALGRLYLAAKDVHAARQVYEGAAKRFPLADWYWVGLSRIEIDRKGDLENAEKWLTKAISSRGADKPPIWVVVDARDAHFLRATLRERKGDVEGARSDLESALALSHDWLPAKSMLQILPPPRKP